MEFYSPIFLSSVDFFVFMGVRKNAEGMKEHRQGWSAKHGTPAKHTSNNGTPKRVTDMSVGLSDVPSALGRLCYT